MTKFVHRSFSWAKSPSTWWQVPVTRVVLQLLARRQLLQHCVVRGEDVLEVVRHAGHAVQRRAEVAAYPREELQRLLLRPGHCDCISLCNVVKVASSTSIKIEQVQRVKQKKAKNMGLKCSTNNHQSEGPLSKF